MDTNLDLVRDLMGIDKIVKDIENTNTPKPQSKKKPKKSKKSKNVESKKVVIEPVVVPLPNPEVVAGPAPSAPIPPPLSFSKVAEKKVEDKKQEEVVEKKEEGKHEEKQEEKQEEKKEDIGLLTVVECDLPVKDVIRILSGIGVGSVGPGSVISSMGRDTNKTIVLMSRDLFNHLEVVDSAKMESITRVEEYNISKCFPPKFKDGETYHIFCRLTKTRLSNGDTLNSAFVKNDVIGILEYMRDINILPNGSYFVDVPTPDRRVGTGGQVEFFFVRLNPNAHGLTAMKVKAFLNGHLLPSSMTVISTFWAREKNAVFKNENVNSVHPKKILQRPNTRTVVTSDEETNGFRQSKSHGKRK